MSPVLVRIASPGRQPLRLIIDAPLDVGREAEGLLVVDDRVSRRHARLEPAQDGQLMITDLESANGVYVDGVKIEQKTVIGVGNTAVIGDTRIEVVARPSAGRSIGTTTLVTRAKGPSAIELAAESIRHTDNPHLSDASREPDTLTIVFSDIEASTEHALEVGDTRWMEILGHHNAIITRHVDDHDGRIVKNRGDGFLICFRSVRHALLASIGIQHELTNLRQTDPELAVRVRIGLHTGEVLQDDDGDLFGRHVLIAARIGDLANGGQILVSSLLKQIAEPRGDVKFSEEIVAELKGIDTPQIVHEVDWRSFADVS